MAAFQQWNTEGVFQGTTPAGTILAETGSLTGDKKFIILLFASVAVTFVIRIKQGSMIVLEHRVVISTGQAELNLTDVPITMNEGITESAMDVINDAVVIGGKMQATILVEP